MDILFLIAGLALILVGANFLTDGAAALAQRFRVPEFVIGLTVMAIGTAIPELVISTLSAIAGKSDMAIGNVVGSNIFNVFVILGVCAMIRPLILTEGVVRRDIPFGMAASLLLLFMLSDRFLHLGAADTISRGDGVVMIALYIALILYTIHIAREEETPASEDRQKRHILIPVVMVAGGLAALVTGGELFLDGATTIARTFGISESVIAITLVAGGASLPELAASVVSLIKGKSDMALGNIIGSNIANILLVLGISATIHPLSMGGITHTDILMVVLSSLMLMIVTFVFRRKAITRWEGIIFLAIYVAYIWHLVR